MKSGPSLKPADNHQLTCRSFLESSLTIHRLSYIFYLVGTSKALVSAGWAAPRGKKKENKPFSKSKRNVLGAAGWIALFFMKGTCR